MNSRKDRRGWRTLPRNVWAVSLTSLFTDISTEMVINLIPLYLANVLGIKTPLIGLIEGIAETTSSVLKVFSGWLSDRLGQRKQLVVLGYFLSSISKPFFAFASTWPGVLLIRWMDRVGKGIRTAPRDALIVDSVEPERRGLAFGVQRSADTFGALLGLVTAYAITTAGGGGVSLTKETFQTAAIASALPAFIAIAILVFGARDIPVKRTKSPPPRLTLKGLPPRFRIFLGIVMIFTLGNSADAFLILRAQERGLDIPGVLLSLLLFNAVYVLLSTPAGSLSDRVGRQRMIAIGWATYGLVYLGFALAQQPWHITAMYTLYGVYYALYDGVAKAFIADMTPAEMRGTAYGVYHAAVGLMAFPASLLAGVLWQGAGGWSGFGPTAPFLAGAVLSASALTLLWVWQWTSRQHA